MNSSKPEKPRNDNDLQQYVCCVGPLLCPAVFYFYFLQTHFLISFAAAFVSYLVQFSWHPILDFYGVSMGVIKKIYGNSI